MIGLGLSLHKIQGVSIGGGGGGPSYTPPLDDYPNADAAYSVRLLRIAYSGSALRVRRNAAPFDEQDIVFTAGGDLDEAAIVAFGGSDVLTVSAWYDQSGQSNHATQITPSRQPQIYNGTAVITENGKPALDWDGTDDVLITTYTPTVTHTAFFVQVPTANTVGFVYASENTFNGRMWVAAHGTNTFRIYRGGTASFSEGTTLSGQYLGYVLNKATVTDMRLGVDGSNVAASGDIGSGVITNLRLGAEDQSGFYGDSRIQEFIIYDSDNSSNRTGIENNIMTYYNIP